MSVEKSVCSCGWRGKSADALTAPNPFDQEDIITGCPKCKEIGSLAIACDEPDCWATATCGWPSDSGYRTTCGKHWIKKEEP